jgi:hypothetical protein
LINDAVHATVTAFAQGFTAFRYTQLPAKSFPRKVEGNRWAGQTLNLRR